MAESDESKAGAAAFGDECGVECPTDSSQSCDLLVSPPSYKHNLGDTMHHGKYGATWPGSGR